MRISDWSSDVCSSDLRAHQAGDTRRPVDDDVIDVARQLRRFTVDRVARQADNAEQPLQSLPAALLRPVQRGTLRVGVDQRDALSTASPFTSEMQGERCLADAALLVEESDDHDEIGRASCRERVCQYV